MSNHTRSISEFIRNSGSTIISVEFVKRNGDIRSIQFNPKDRNEIKGFGAVTQNPDIIRVRDFKVARENGSGAWRSFNINSVLKITSNGQVYNFNEEVTS